MAAFKNVIAFVDWNSQIHLCSPPEGCVPTDLCEFVLRATAKRIATCLARAAPAEHFRVGLRLYHGWHKGFEPSPNRKAIRQVLASTDFATLSNRREVVFGEEVGFGDCLVSATSIRYHPALAIHLPNTLRDRGDGRSEEKMVDTAMAADLLFTAFRDPQDWIVVVAEDDDMIPPLFVAETFTRTKGSRVLLMSGRRRSKNFLKLDGILVEEC